MSDKDILYLTANNFFLAGDGGGITLDDVSVYMHEGKMHVSINCSDVFYWGTADYEEVTEENMPLLREARLELVAANEDTGFWLGDLFCAKVRKMRPQGAWYKRIDDCPKTKELFDACGPRRTPDFFNPKEQD